MSMREGLNVFGPNRYDYGLNIGDDFGGAALDTFKWNKGVEADGTAQSTVDTSAADGGTLVISTGAVANDFGLIATDLVFVSGRYLEAVLRYKVSGSPDSFAFGFSDAITESNGLIVSDTGATPVAAPTDGAMFAFESANGSGNLCAVVINDDADTVTDLSIAPGTSYQELRIRAFPNGSVEFYVDGVLKHKELPGAIDASNALCGIVACSNVAGTITPDITIDWVNFYGAKA